MEINLFKRCVNCKKVKPYSEFNKHSNTKDGLQPWCQECQRSYMREFSKKQNSEQAQKEPAALGRWKVDFNDNGIAHYYFDGVEISAIDVNDFIWLINHTQRPPTSQAS